VEELEPGPVHLVHEMGGTIFSERVVSQIRRLTSGDIAQSLDFGPQLADLPDNPFRILGFQVITDAAASLSHVALLMRDPEANQEFPVWVWDGTNSRTIRIIDDNNAVANLGILTPEPGMSNYATMMFGPESRLSVPDLVLRGTTTAFGAGTVETIALVHIAFAEVSKGGISAYGLPLPGW